MKIYNKDHEKTSVGQGCYFISIDFCCSEQNQ